MARGNRTGGPKTTAGKLASSKNALKTAAYAVTVILPGDQEEKFLELKIVLLMTFGLTILPNFQWFMI